MGKKNIIKSSISNIPNTIGNSIQEYTDVSKLEIAQSFSDHIDDNYMDQLMQLPLHDQSKKQLENIKNMLISDTTSDKTKNIKKDRLTIQNGFVLIDGFGLPIEYQSSGKTMNTENDISLGSEAMIAWLNFIAEFTDRPFDRGKVTKESLMDGTLGSYNIYTQLNNSSNNRSILISLSKIISKDGYILMGMGMGMGMDQDQFGTKKDKYFICAELVPGNVGFIISYHSDNHNRLIVSETTT